MQGVEKWIPTELKTRYINSLLKVGFDVLDFGSFVSPKAIPQLKDTADVLKGIELSGSDTKLLAIIANERGAEDASAFEEITYLGFPFSISETFQQRNTNSSIEQSLRRVESINNIAQKWNKQILIYISMAFGNPYGDPWSPDLASHWIDRLNESFGIQNFALADTVGMSNVQNIESLFKMVIADFSMLSIGAHLHSTPEMAVDKLKAAFDAGCRNFDVALYGFGGCPMAEDVLVGNVSTQSLIEAFVDEPGSFHLDFYRLQESERIASLVFG
ncbi:MAG: hydroxymethylglutaryl-CoA lyase [Flavobacteriales bacterium]